MRYLNIPTAITMVFIQMKDQGVPIQTDKWQGMDIREIPGSEMVELLHVTFQAPMGENWVEAVKPNLPWADNHFQERVCGAPINPGVEWANWPWAYNAEESLVDGKFNHNYMERYWPRQAGISQPTQVPGDYPPGLTPMKGIYHDYGDLGGVTRLLARDPTTRQAYLPVWFPEDTGDSHSGRKPCTLGYHFICRNGKLDVVYYIRSCDLYRHFRDDIYLTLKLAEWVLMKCREQNPAYWNKVELGDIRMHITSLHMFINDYRVRFRSNPNG